LRHEVYVWQRAWTQPVRDAVTNHSKSFSRIVPLKVEISWNERQPRMARVAVDYEALKTSSQSVGLALRIGPFPGPFASNDPIAGILCDTATGMVAEARINGVALAELQVDFDCAESKLAGYALWIQAIQARVSPVPVTITALPSWLNAPAFSALARLATNYVLQVHSLDRPKSWNAAFSLCPPLAAHRAVERAGRIGVPFRVALPTYGYVMAFDVGGKFLGLHAEGPRPDWPTNAVLREVRANREELSALLREWTFSRPPALRGVIWYRLPTTQDRFNWKWEELETLVRNPRPWQEALKGSGEFPDASNRMK
jgi:hypothetical protein